MTNIYKEISIRQTYTTNRNNTNLGKDNEIYEKPDK